MDIGSFNPRAFSVGEKHRLYLELTQNPDGTPLQLPLFLARGTEDGPTLLVFGGVHGDEYEGPHAIRQVFDQLDARQLRGTLLMVPHVNVPAVNAGTRNSPIDGANLARVFPGSPEGTITERIADLVGRHLIERATLLLDLHSSGSYSEMPLLIGYFHGDSAVAKASRAAAEIFGAPVVWGHPGPTAPGRTISYAEDHGIPWLYTECPGGGWLNREAVICYTRGTVNVMRHLGMLPGTPDVPPATLHLVGNGNTDQSVAVTRGGFLVSRVNALDRVEKGQLLGVVADPLGNVIDEVTAPRSGHIILLRHKPLVYAGERVYLVS